MDLKMIREMMRRFCRLDNFDLANSKVRNKSQLCPTTQPRTLAAALFECAAGAN